jgi:hypothetical protein
LSATFSRQGYEPISSCGAYVVLWRFSESARTGRPNGGLAVARQCCINAISALPSLF